MADIDEPIERLDRHEDIVAFVRRPPGIAVLIGLFVFAGVAHLAAAAGAGIFGATAPLSELFAEYTATVPFLADPAVFGGIGIVLAIVAIADFVIAWALWDLRTWAWGWAVGLSIIELLVVPFGFLMGVLRLVYLSMADVRAAYREEGRTLRAEVAARRRRRTA